MNLTALALLGLALGVGEPSTDYFPIKSRTLKMDIDFKPEERSKIQEVQLCVSRDQGQTWQVADVVTPEKDHFIFNAKEDGPHWVTMLIVFKDGHKDPVHPSKTPRDRIQQLLVDVTPPTVRVTSAKPIGAEVEVEWTIDDAFPSNAAAQVAYKAVGAPDTEWKQVPPTAVKQRSARFHPEVSGPIIVRVTGSDLAGNTNSDTLEAGPSVGTGPLALTSADTPKPGVGIVSPTPGGIAPPSGDLIVPTMLGAGNDAIKSVAGSSDTMTAPTIGELPPPILPAPSAPTPAPTLPPAGAAPTTAAPIAPTLPAPIAPSPASSPSWTTLPPPAPTNTNRAGESIIATSNGQTPAKEAPLRSDVKYINYARFDLNYQVENGPSGVSRVDLYVTRDNGRSWMLWSQHDGREVPLKVSLESRYNTQPEGEYGFRLVPFSGAGISSGAPTPGTPPEMRVSVDLTPPVLDGIEPTFDPAMKNVLILRWRATDKNFGKDPISIDWSESPNGPWRSVSGGAVVPAFGAIGQPAPKTGLPNTGSYAWQIPMNLTTPQVYLKYTVEDAAGNRSEAVTPKPVLVDLIKPRATISGISGMSISPR